MADVTPILIKDLAAQTTLQDTDYFIVGGADAKKITVAQMKEALGINELNTKIQGSGSIINTYLSTSRSTCKWIRQGDIVTVYFQITASDAIPNEVPIINNFPKPISNVYSAAPSNNTSNPSFAYTINTNGELYRNYGGALNAGETCYGSITYITEDT